jgi:hypothetical protein
MESKRIAPTNHKDDLKYLRLFSDRQEVSKGMNREKTIKTTIVRYYLKDVQSGMVIKRNNKIEEIFIYDN